MSKDKCPNILWRKGGYCVCYPLKIFPITRSFKNWGTSLGYSPDLAGAYSSHVMGLGQSCASKNIRNIILSNKIFYSSVLGNQVTEELRG